MDLVEARRSPVRRHPWEVARARFFVKALRDAGMLDAPRTVMDVGAGDGYVAKTLLDQLPSSSSVVCVDANYADADIERFGASAPSQLVFTRERPTSRFDLILLLDVLEHVEDDRGFLEQIVRENLAPNGVVVVSVPAWQGLFSAHDEALKHHRRYRPAALRELLSSAGLAAQRSGGLFHSLLIPRALHVAIERLSRRTSPPSNAGEWRGGALVSSVLEGALSIDNALSRGLARTGLDLPGLSLYAICGARK